MSRTRRAIWTFALSLAASAVGILVGLVTVPLLLRYLGDERLGVYRIVLEWLGYASLIEFGLSGSLHVLISRGIGSGDRLAVASAVRAGFRGAVLTTFLGLVYTVIIVILAPLLVGELSPEIEYELRVGLLLGLLGSICGPLVAFRPLAEASQRGYLVHLGLVAQSLAIAFMSVGFAAVGFGLAGQFVAIGIGNGIALTWLTVDGLRRYPEILSRPSASPAPLKSAFSSSIFLFQLLSRVSLHSDCIVVGYILGPVSVVVFSLTQRLIMIVDGQVLALGGASWAGLAELYHVGKIKDFHDRLTQLTRWTAILACALVVPVACFSREIVTLWVGFERFGGNTLVWSTAIYVWLHGVVGLWSWPIVSMGRVRAILPAMTIAAIVNISVSIGFTAWIGVAGPAIGSAVSMGFVLCGSVTQILNREFGTPTRPLLHAALGPAILALPYAAVCALLINEYSPWLMSLSSVTKWILTLGSMAIQAFGYLGISWYLLISQSERNGIHNKINRRIIMN